MTWRDLEGSAPRIAARGRELLTRTGTAEGMLTTVLGAGLPRSHPVVVAILDGHLLVFSVDGSPKTRDLLADGRYALHSHLDPAAPHEFLVRGHARRVTEPGLLAQAVAGWPFDAAEGYVLFELGIEHALLGERDTRDDWPPRYASWRAPAASATVTR